MAVILCFGDSLTYGFDPATGGRFPPDSRWPDELARRTGHTVITEALPGRTTVFDSPYADARSGRAMLPAILESHAPVDLVILMLGTNDLQAPLELSARHSASGLWTLIDLVNRSDGPPACLVVAPPPIVEPKGFMGVFFEGREARVAGSRRPLPDDLRADRHRVLRRRGRGAAVPGRRDPPRSGRTGGAGRGAGRTGRADSVINVDFLLFEGMDLMDFGGPWEVFLTANRLLERQGGQAGFAPVAFSPDGEPVTSYGGVAVAPTGRARTDGILIVPGTIDVDAATGDAELIALVAGAAQGREVVASVCTGAFLLAAAGKLPDRWTTHWEDIAGLALPGGTRARVVDAGTVVTGGGIACGIDLGLHLVARFVDSALARLVARQMDYAWDYYGDPAGGVEPVVVERDVACPPDRVYRLWTTAEGVGEFLGVTARIEPRVGGPYEFAFLAEAPDGVRGGEGCRILALEPDRLVVFSWNSPPGFETRGQHTWVVLSLTPVAAGTRVRLAHWGHGSGPQWDANREYFTAAWASVLDALAGYCDGAVAPG